MRVVVYTDKAAAEARIDQIGRDLGYPRESVSQGGGIQPAPGECLTLRYCDLVESSTGQYGIPIEQKGEATLSAGVRSRISEVDPAWVKADPDPARKALIEEQEAEKP